MLILSLYMGVVMNTASLCIRHAKEHTHLVPGTVNPMSTVSLGIFMILCPLCLCVRKLDMLVSGRYLSALGLYL